MYKTREIVKEIKKALPEHYIFNQNTKQNIKQIIQFNGRNRITEQLIAIYYYPGLQKQLYERDQKIYKAMAGSLGFPSIRYQTTTQKAFIIVTDDFLVDLFTLYQKIPKLFTPQYICVIIEQILNRIKDMHSEGYIYQDLRPDTLGYKAKAQLKIIYFTRFKYTKRYLDDKDEHIKEKQTNLFVGSPGYASRRQHQGLNTSRKDDLESLFYILWYFHYGKFPWYFDPRASISKFEKLKHILKTKKRLKRLDSFKELPEAYQSYYFYVDKLKFKEEPDYYYLRNLFVQHRRMQSIKQMKSTLNSNDDDRFIKMNTIEECSKSMEFSIVYNSNEQNSITQMNEEMQKQKTILAAQSEIKSILKDSADLESDILTKMNKPTSQSHLLQPKQIRVNITSFTHLSCNDQQVIKSGDMQDSCMSGFSNSNDSKSHEDPQFNEEDGDSDSDEISIHVCKENENDIDNSALHSDSQSYHRPSIDEENIKIKLQQYKEQNNEDYKQNIQESKQLSEQEKMNNQKQIYQINQIKCMDRQVTDTTVTSQDCDDDTGLVFKMKNCETMNRKVFEVFAFFSQQQQNRTTKTTQQRIKHNYTCTVNQVNQIPNNTQTIYQNGSNQNK